MLWSTTQLFFDLIRKLSPQNLKINSIITKMEFFLNFSKFAFFVIYSCNVSAVSKAQ